jgi:resuscitation-promoting factor RpfB
MMTAPRATLRRLAVIFAFLWLMAGCAAPQISQAQSEITVTLHADGETRLVQVAAGSSIAQALTELGLTLGTLDRLTPPGYALLRAGDEIRITRVREEFETRQEIIPFERQTVRNEALPDGETRLIQPGRSGAQELTVRRLFEDGQESSAVVVKTVILQESLPEIWMVGAQSAFAPLPIAGKLVFISNGNAWIMEGSTANRRAIITTGDLDGRVLRLSADGNSILFTRKSTRPPEEEINTLWVYKFSDPRAQPINLKAPNVIHFADFVPGQSLYVAYSSVEPRAAAPGWQANNDLNFVRYGENGAVGQPLKVILPNTGGVYGWWGTNFVFAPLGTRIAYARPDGIGLVDIRENEMIPLLDITPLQTRGDWALIPAVAWAADNSALYVVTHAPPPGLLNPEESPIFDLSALSLRNGAQVQMVRESGMFAYPSVSPARQSGDEQGFLVAYLQAIFPGNSDSSRYRLMVMDRDGSNRRALFPPQGSLGLEPQIPAWAPAPISANEGDFIAIVYNKNLWLIDIATGEAHQITGDGMVSKVIWTD